MELVVNSSGVRKFDNNPTNWFTAIVFDATENVTLRNWILKNPKSRVLTSKIFTSSSFASKDYSWIFWYPFSSEPTVPVFNQGDMMLHKAEYYDHTWSLFSSKISRGKWTYTNLQVYFDRYAKKDIFTIVLFVDPNIRQFFETPSLSIFAAILLFGGAVSLYRTFKYLVVKRLSSAKKKVDDVCAHQSRVYWKKCTHLD